MNDEPKRLLDEDPDGAAGLLIRAALKDGPPPPKGAKERTAKQLGLESATVIPWRGRRIAAWSAGATILAAAAGAIFFVLPQKSQMEPVSSESIPPRTATAIPMAAPPSEPAAPLPMATSMPLPMATSMPPVKSATTGSARPPSSAKSGAPKSPPAPKKRPEQFKF